MSVANGQLANQTTFNNAFLSRVVDTSTIGRIDLNNAVAASGPAVVNVQREINSQNSFTGRASGSAFDATPSYTSNNSVTDGDTLTAAIGKLDAEFDPATGHEHSGAAGDGPPVKRFNVLGATANNTSTGNVDALTTVGLTQVRLTGASAVTLRGIDDGSLARQVTVMNVTGSPLIVQDEAVAAAAADRIVTGTGASITIEDGGSVFLEYDSVSSRWRVIGGPGGESIVAYQEVCSGIVDGVNADFGLSVTPVNDDSVWVAVDGVQRDKGTHWTISGTTITFLAPHIPEAGQSPYAFYLYKQSGGVAPGVGTNGSPKTEYRTLSAGEIAAKQLTLAQTPIVSSEILVDTATGTINVFSVDFTVSGNVVSWTGLGFDGLLTAGDVLRIHYYY